MLFVVYAFVIALLCCAAWPGMGALCCHLRPSSVPMCPVSRAGRANMDSPAGGRVHSLAKWNSPQGGQVSAAWASFCRAMLCISAAYAVVRCLSVMSVCHVRVFCKQNKHIKSSSLFKKHLKQSLLYFLTRSQPFNEMFIFSIVNPVAVAALLHRR